MMQHFCLSEAMGLPEFVETFLAIEDASRAWYLKAKEVTFTEDRIVIDDSNFRLINGPFSVPEYPCQDDFTTGEEFIRDVELYENVVAIYLSTIDIEYTRFALYLGARYGIRVETEIPKKIGDPCLISVFYR